MVDRKSEELKATVRKVRAGEAVEGFTMDGDWLRGPNGEAWQFQGSERLRMVGHQPPVALGMMVDPAADEAPDAPVPVPVIKAPKAPKVEGLTPNQAIALAAVIEFNESKKDATAASVAEGMCLPGQAIRVSGYLSSLKEKGCLITELIKGKKVRYLATTVGGALLKAHNSK